MAERATQHVLAAIRDAAHALSGSPEDYDAVIAAAREVQFVLLGEASHGTHEFYSARAEITKRLITELGFAAVAVEAVLEYLDKVDPDGAQRARARYACFDHFGEDSKAYGYPATAGLAPSCEDEVVTQLIELRQRAADYASRDGRIAPDELFYAEQNARLVASAE